MNLYEARDVALRAMGYANYAAYLASETWCDIRTRVYGRQNGRCRCCPSRLTDVHHKDYEPKTLTGETIAGLVGLCRQCHTQVEFDVAGQRRNQADALQTLNSLIAREDEARKRFAAVKAEMRKRVTFKVPKVQRIPKHRFRRDHRGCRIH